ncbi:MAG: hypothetical protein QOG63_772, partial [Thermoleophilaceae bacterium]|nr:hypothetical protein [Thermoleophilaceae bacterium]
MATRKSPPKKKTTSRTTARRKPARRSQAAARPALPQLRVPRLDDHQLDIVGLGLV